MEPPEQFSAWERYIAQLYQTFFFQLLSPVTTSWLQWSWATSHLSNRQPVAVGTLVLPQCWCWSWALGSGYNTVWQHWWPAQSGNTQPRGRWSPAVPDQRLLTVDKVSRPTQGSGLQGWTVLHRYPLILSEQHTNSVIWDKPGLGLPSCTEILATSNS